MEGWKRWLRGFWSDSGGGGERESGEEEPEESELRTGE